MAIRHIVGIAVILAVVFAAEGRSVAGAADAKDRVKILERDPEKKMDAIFKELEMAGKTAVEMKATMEKEVKDLVSNDETGQTESKIVEKETLGAKCPLTRSHHP
ncbi:Hypp8915 [Branchiostoma lanceolatum]|uniref:Hypp8915 protein n=1 Tax=Branchiostoma lanceolatum TaxID=7740 RepID=A0A8K0EJP6_BRALA|nr:Hypp8915 [Branchiostoma lanceolatum]